MRDEGGQINQSVGRRRKVSRGSTKLSEVARTGQAANLTRGQLRRGQPGPESLMFKRRTLVGTSVSADRDKVEGGRVANS